MSEDWLVTRLRERNFDSAADEIMRLRADLSAASSKLDAVTKERNELLAKLREPMFSGVHNSPYSD